MNKVQIMCPVCKESNLVSVYSQDGYTMYSCKDCLHIFLDPLPEIKEHSGWKSSPDKPENMFKILFEISETLKNKVSGPSIMDLPTGTGWFLKVLDPNFWKIAACEPSDQLAKVASSKTKGIVWCCDALEVPVKNEFHCVTILNRLENFADPYQVLEKAKNLLVPQGVLFIMIKNDSFLLHLKESSWQYILNKRDYYSKESLEILLNRSNFVVEEIWEQESNILAICKKF